ncbi:HAD family hydrolase [Geobacillus subterraneus]|uniref:HAD family hydrolase n=1 Tax=Geobacillus subterraneus TaxID=129338 RepID=UPI001442C5FE|nr:HAD-IA family hydrolase [Geobacillus subterraneus]QIZ68365.1 HAD-IA family hydrolase [Geobacillus subterraneus]
MKRWEAVWFDLDETLIDYERTFCAAIRHCFHHFFPAAPVSFSVWFPIFKEACDRHWDDYEAGTLTRRAYRRVRFLDAARACQIEADEEMADRFHAYFDEAVSRFAVALPGMTDLLGQLRAANVPLGVISNGSGAIQRGKLAACGLHRFFRSDAVVISEEVGYKKPAAAIFHYARNKRPSEQLVYVGDSWKLDVEGALGAGWEAVYFRPRQPAPVGSSVPVCRTVGELAVLLLNGLGLVGERERGT